MANRYWVGSGTWNSSNTANWSDTSTTGPTGASVPTAADDVVFDASSGNCDLAPGGRLCRSLDASTYTGAMVFSSGGTATLSVGDSVPGPGNVAFRLSAAMTFTTGGGSFPSTITFASTSTTAQTITTAGKTLGNVTFNGVGGKWTLQDALTSSGTLSLTTGTFDTNNQNVTTSDVNAGGLLTKTLTLGSTAWATNSWAVRPNGTTVTANTAVVTVATTFDVNSVCGCDYNGMSVVQTSTTTHGIGYQGSFPITLRNYTRTGPASTAGVLNVGTSLTLTGTLTITGNSSINRLLAQSDVLGTPRVITAAAVSLTDVDFMDIAIVGPTGSTITSDSFNRADGLLSGSSSDAAAGGSPIAWSALSNFNIASNRSTAASNSSYITIPVATSNMEVSALVPTLPTGGHAGVAARISSITKLVFFGVSNASTQSTLYYSTGSTFNSVACGLVSAGSTISLRVIDQIAVALVNGIVVGTLAIPAASSFTSPNNAGLQQMSTGTIDDFVVKNLASVTGTRLGDCLGNSGITFTTASGTPRDGGGAGVKRYAVAPGNFSDTAMWSETSGGAPGASVPLPQDDVYLDASSAAGTYTVNMPRVCRNLDLTGFTRTFILPSSTTAYNFYGNVITPASGYTYTGQNTVLIHLRGRGSHTLAIDSWTGNFNYGIGVYIGTYTLTQNTTSALALNANGPRFDIYSNGTLNTGGYNFGASAVVPQTAGRFVANSSTVNLGWTIDCSGGGSVDGANATFVYITTPVFPGTSNRGLTGNALSAFGTVTWTEANAPGSLTLAGANTIGTLNIGSGRSLRLTSGTTQKIGTLNLNGVPRGGVRLPGVGGTYLSTPDSAAVSVTGDIDIRVRVALTDWTPGASQALIGKYVSTANQGSYILAIDTGGRPNFLVSDSGGGGSWVYVGGAAWVDGTTYWVRVTHTMAGLLRFFYAADSSTMPTSWTQLGSDQTAFTYGKYDSTAPLEIGSYGNGVSMNAVGTFYRAQIRNNVLDDGSGIVFDTDLTVPFGPRFYDTANGAVVTPSNTLANVGDGRVLIESATAGSAATLQVDSVTNMNYVDLKDVVMNGADTYIGATSVIRSNVKGVRRGPKTGLGV